MSKSIAVTVGQIQNCGDYIVVSDITLDSIPGEEFRFKFFHGVDVADDKNPQRFERDAEGEFIIPRSVDRSRNVQVSLTASTRHDNWDLLPTHGPGLYRTDLLDTVDGKKIIEMISEVTYALYERNDAEEFLFRKAHPIEHPCHRVGNEDATRAYLDGLAAIAAKLKDQSFTIKLS